MARRGSDHPRARQLPAEFREMFARLGWEEIEDHYQTNQRAVHRWMREAGGKAEMIALRRGYMRKVYAARGLPSAGGRKPKCLPEMRAGDPALAFMPVRRLRRRYEGEI